MFCQRYELTSTTSKQGDNSSQRCKILLRKHVCGHVKIGPVNKCLHTFMEHHSLSFAGLDYLNGIWLVRRHWFQSL